MRFHCKLKEFSVFYIFQKKKERNKIHTFFEILTHIFLPFFRSKENVEHSHEFILSTPERDYRLRASSSSERQRWVTALKSVKTTESMPLNLSAASNPHFEVTLDLLQTYWNAEGPVHKRAETIALNVKTNPFLYRLAIRGTFIISSPTGEDFQNEVRDIHNRLHDRWPNQRWIFETVEDIKPLGGFYYQLGYVDIHRSLDMSTPHFLSVIADDHSVHDASFVQSDKVVFSLIKTLAFPHKLNILDQMIQRNDATLTVNPSDLFGKVLMSICSDIAYEYGLHVSANTVDLSDLTNRISTLYQLIQFPFQSKGRE